MLVDGFPKKISSFLPPLLPWCFRWLQGVYGSLGERERGEFRWVLELKFPFSFFSFPLGSSPDSLEFLLLHELLGDFEGSEDARGLAECLQGALDCNERRRLVGCPLV